MIEVSLVRRLGEHRGVSFALRKRRRVQHHERAEVAVSELHRLDGEYAAIIASLDHDAAMRRAVRLVPGAVGVDSAYVGEPGADDTIVLNHLVGCRTSAIDGLVVHAGKGLGGRVFALGEPVWVTDYPSAEGITHDYDQPVATEGLHGMIGVPLFGDDRVIAVLYGAAHTEATFGDGAINAMVGAATQISLAVTVAERARHAAEVAVHEERRRMAMALHDSVGAMLFAIGAGVRNLGDDEALPPAVRARLVDVEGRAHEAAATLRESLRALSASPDDLALGVSLRADCRAFEERTGVAARLLTMSEVPPLDAARAKVLVDTAREALLNVEKHAGASSVVISLFAARGGVSLTVADNGVGLDRTGSSRLGSDDGAGLGINATAERLGRVGGYLTLAPNEDGGVTVKAWVPC